MVHPHRIQTGPGLAKLLDSQGARRVRHVGVQPFNRLDESVGEDRFGLAVATQRSVRAERLVQPRRRRPTQTSQMVEDRLLERRLILPSHSSPHRLKVQLEIGDVQVAGHQAR